MLPGLDVTAPPGPDPVTAAPPAPTVIGKAVAVTVISADPSRGLAV